jgi:hypothetical protein
VLGNALKRIADRLDPAPSDLDPGRARALYHDLYETPLASAAKTRHNNSVPHPYVIAGPFSKEEFRVERGADAIVGLTLIGRGNEALGAIIAGFRRAAEAGIGTTRGRMVLERVDAVSVASDGLLPVYRPGQRVMPAPTELLQSPAAPRFVEIRLETPLRIEESLPSNEAKNRPDVPRSLQFDPGLSPAKRHQRKRVVRDDQFRPSHLLFALVRRVSDLSNCYAEPHHPDREVLQVVGRVRMVERDFGWYSQPARWSASQRQQIPVDGIVGRFVLDLSDADKLYPYLWLGQSIHAGKGTVMGMGAIRVTPLD